MKATFIEISGFSECREDYLADVAYTRLQQLLMANPNAGDVMPGCGGLRKVRTADARRGKGKRGGARVIYLHFPEANRFYLLDIYGKDEKDDLSTADKKRFLQIATDVKAEAIAQHRKQQEPNR